MASAAMVPILNPNSNPNPNFFTLNICNASLTSRTRRRPSTAPPRPFFTTPFPLRHRLKVLRAGSDDAGYATSADPSVNQSTFHESPAQDGYIGLFVGMLALDKDPLDREQAVDTLWKYSQGGRQCVDSIMQFPGCINLVISLLRSDSFSTCQAAAGLLRTISSINIYRASIAESGAIEEIAALLRRSSLTPEVKEQSLCVLWNLSVEEGPRGKIVNSDLLPALVKFLDDDEINIKEAAGGVLANIALSRCNHNLLVENGVIPKLAGIMRSDAEGHKIVRKKARNTLLELCKDEYNKILVIEEGLIPVPIVGSAAYKSYKTVPYFWPSLPDGTELPRNSTPSRYGATELLIGLNKDDIKLDESQIKAVVARSRQQFLVRIGAIERGEYEKSQIQNSMNERQTLLALEDGIARLVLILQLEDASAVSRAARAIGDSSITEHIRVCFKDAGAIKSLVPLLCHTEEIIRESAGHALERLSMSNKVCHVIESENLFIPMFGIIKSSSVSENMKEKIVNILARIFNPQKFKKTELIDKVKRPSGDLNLSQMDELTKDLFAPPIEVGGSLVDLDVVCCLVNLLKISSCNMQRKVTNILEYLANFDVYLSAIANAGLDSALFAVLYQRCFHGEDNYEQMELDVVEDAGLVVEAASRLLTKLLDFEQFYSKIDLIPLLNLLRKILKSSIPLHAKDWVAACLVKMQLLVGSERGVDDTIGIEVTLYETIPRLIEQMKMSPSLEYREAAIINLNDIVSKGMIECSRAVALSGGIFPLVEMMDQVNGPALEAGLAILYNLSMDSENHNAIISAGAIPVLRRIVLSQKPQWPLALNLLRTLPT